MLKGLVSPENPRVDFQTSTGLSRNVGHGMLYSMQEMKMLFSAQNRAQIEQVRNQLVTAGIRCEIRTFRVETAGSGTTAYPELWVQANPDYHTASILYASPLRLLRERASGR